MGLHAQTATWLHKLAYGHHQGSGCIPEIQPWAGCQGELILLLLFERYRITLWKMLSNYWSYKKPNLKKKSIKLLSLGAKIKTWVTGFPSKHSTNSVPNASNLTPADLGT